MLKLYPEQLESLSDDQIVDRWCTLFKGPLLIQQYRSRGSLTSPDRATVSDIVNVWRTKLASISWFMRCLNQPIARQANLEDKCTGKSWESRFTSQALKSDAALLSCMAYVDLNPVRSGVAASPETSDYTSIKERIHPIFKLDQAIGDQQESGDLLDFRAPLKPLLRFEGEVIDGPQSSITFGYQDYLKLVDWSDRIIRDDKRGFIDKALPPNLARLDITPEQWRINVTQFEFIHARRFNRLKSSIDSG